jgi:hypothetical protein
MQLLYSLDRDPGVSHKDLLRRYDQAVDLAYESLLFNLFIILEITHQAVSDRDARHAKLRPGPEDPLWWLTRMTYPELVKTKHSGLILINVPLAQDWIRIS